MRKDIFKYMISFVVVLFFRIVPHPPNVEGITSTLMPFSKKWGWIGGIIFGVFSVLVFDLITGTIGMWTISTAGMYALIAVLASYYLKRRNRIIHYVGFSVFATLLYDAVTGVIFGTLVFGQPFMMTLMGQIPFTLYHLAGNVVLAGVLSPLLYRWVMDNPEMDRDRLLSRVFQSG